MLLWHLATIASLILSNHFSGCSLQQVETGLHERSQVIPITVLHFPNVTNSLFIRLIALDPTQYRATVTA
jgi:hypothetical protein